MVLRMPHGSTGETFGVKSNKKACVELRNSVVIIKENHERLRAIMVGESFDYRFYE